MEEEVLFHGTSKDYHNDMVKQFGVYKHQMNNKPVYLTTNPKYAMELAETRASEWGDWPAVLVVYKNRVPDITIKEGDIHPSCAELHPDWYDFVPAEENQSLECKVE